MPAVHFQNIPAAGFYMVCIHEVCRLMRRKGTPGGKVSEVFIQCVPIPSNLLEF